MPIQRDDVSAQPGASGAATPELTVEDNWLHSGDLAIERRDCGKSSGGLALDTIIIHYTAGAGVASSVETLCDPNVAASAHLVVGRAGEIVQLVPFDRASWHAGKSAYTFPSGELRRGFNSCSVGIEIDNPGELTRSQDGYQTWYGAAVAPENVIRATHRNQNQPRFWHAYTPLQIALVTGICRALMASYGIRHILGHEEISPGRKIDPGPAFPLDKLRGQLVGGNRRDDTDSDLYPVDGRVRVSRLNIRAEASPAGERLAKPLGQGTPVQVMREQDGWYYVRSHIEGWVQGRYIDLES